MKEIFTKYKLKLVRDEDFEYESGNIYTQEKLCQNFTNVFRLHEEPEEVCVMLCFAGQNNVIGAFELSEGYNLCNHYSNERNI